MTLILTLLTSLALANTTDEYTWDVTLNGNKVGERSLTVENVDDPNNPRRVLRSYTSIEASVLGRSASFEQ